MAYNHHCLLNKKLDWNQRSLSERESHYELIGAIIRQAVLDFQAGYKRIDRIQAVIDKIRKVDTNKRTNVHKAQMTYYTNLLYYYDDAKSWLFGPDGLEGWLKDNGLDGDIKIDYIRRKILTERISVDRVEGTFDDKKRHSRNRDRSIVSKG